jgi:hypothetical protein
LGAKVKKLMEHIEEKRVDSASGSREEEEHSPKWADQPAKEDDEAEYKEARSRFSAATIEMEVERERRRREELANERRRTKTRRSRSRGKQHSNDEDDDEPLL